MCSRCGRTSRLDDCGVRKSLFMRHVALRSRNKWPSFYKWVRPEGRSQEVRGKVIYKLPSSCHVEEEARKI